VEKESSVPTKLSYLADIIIMVFNQKEDILSNLKIFKSFYLEKISDLENN